MFQVIDHAARVGVSSHGRHEGALCTIALPLVAVGVSALLVALAQYRTMLHHLSTGTFGDIAGIVDRATVTPATFVALLRALASAVAFAALPLRTATV
jgi:hypothetical protein